MEKRDLRRRGVGEGRGGANLAARFVSPFFFSFLLLLLFFPSSSSFFSFFGLLGWERARLGGSGDGSVDGWMDGWMDDGWMDILRNVVMKAGATVGFASCTHTHTHTHTHTRTTPGPSAFGVSYLGLSPVQ
ncbi:hypothetical protein LX32DRAFT_12930 [Colletotrichum zoysiae]|uniref:Uncharacterized protein n=1 Tax=Colletotrichum zoysiae TaxID=1216348 RepID=A0AAD9LY69_9PEZI|nr:hypothetical protein LX32DRAFT_12930 [Colletotrichum zoysiae]